MDKMREEFEAYLATRHELSIIGWENSILGQDLYACWQTAASEAVERCISIVYRTETREQAIDAMNDLRHTDTGEKHD